MAADQRKRKEIPMNPQQGLNRDLLNRLSVQANMLAVWSFYVM
jgi:hypothetical protein